MGGLVPASLMKSVICCLMNVASLVRLVAGSVYKCVFLCVIERFNFFITQLLQLKYKHFVVVVIVKHFCSQASSVEGTN